MQVLLDWLLFAIDWLVVFVGIGFKIIHLLSGYILRQIDQRHLFASDDFRDPRFEIGSDVSTSASDNRKQVVIASPPPKTGPIPVVLEVSWEGVRAIDGVPEGHTEKASFRYKKKGFRLVHLQGSLDVQQYKNTGLYRIAFDGHHSVGSDGQAIKGDPVKGSLYLPVDAVVTAKRKLGKSHNTSNKLLALKYDFQDNDEALEFIQVFILLGYEAEGMSEAKRFQRALDKALDVFETVDDE